MSLTYPTLTFFEPDSLETQFTLTLDQILGLTIEVPTGKVVGFDQVQYYLLYQDTTKKEISRQSWFTLNGMMTTLVAGTAPVPEISRSQIDVLTNTSGVYRTWLIPLLLTPPVPLP